MTMTDSILPEIFHKTLCTRKPNEFTSSTQNFSGTYKFSFDLLMIQLGVPFERDPELDLIKIDNVPKKL